MPRLSLKPVPKKRFHGGRWRIYWKWNGRQYSIPTNYLDPKKTTLVDSDLRFISAALAMEEPDFPEQYAELPQVINYMLDRYGSDSLSSTPSDPNWLNAYQSHLFHETSKGWATHSMRYLTRLADFVGGDIRLTTSSKAQEFLDSIMSSGKSAGTRNRALAASNRFFKWAIRTRRTRRNPFEGIKLLSENNHDDIVYCTEGERQEIIDMARASGWPDWIAVPIAFYAGLRREEICRLLWSDVRLTSNNERLTVRKSKTGKRREVPLASELIDLLKSIPESERIGYVVKMPGDTGKLQEDNKSRPNRLTDLKIHLRRQREANLSAEWRLSRPRLYTQKPRSLTIEQWNAAKKEYRKAKKLYQIRLDQKKELLNTHLKRIGWNSFRHTFGSLRAQNGVSLDKISSWMGNTPEVCRRHYAQFVPRDHRDLDIDK